MKRINQTTARGLAAGTAIALIALLALLGMASAPPTEANQPEAQITGLFNPDFGIILQLAPTATPRPLDLSGILIDPNANVRPFVTVPPVLAIPSPAPTPEPCGQAMSIGQTVNGALAGGGQLCEYTFEARAGRAVNIAMRRTSGTIDPMFELRGPSSGRIAMNDDSDGRGNSALQNYTLNEAGTYTVVARAFDPAATGAFTLRVSGGRPNQPTSPSLAGADEVLCTGSLAYGGSVVGQVPFPGAECRYTFDGIQTNTVALTVKGLEDGPLPDIQLVDPKGRAVSGTATTLDDGTAMLSELLLPSTGSYTVVLTDASEDGTGPFELGVIRQDPCKDVLPNSALRSQISEDNPVCTFALQNPNPFYARLQVTPLSGDLQPVVRFYGPNGEVIDEYLADGTSKRVPENTWTIVVEGQDGTTGLFKIELTGGAQYLLSDEFCGGSIRAGQFVRDTMGPFLPTCSYTFDGQAGDVVTIRMTRQSFPQNDLDTYLTLLDPEENPEATDDDGGLPPTNSLIKQHTLEQTGRYTIVAGSYNDASTGPFYLTFWQRSP
ncbi:MAG: PPC domain-containing protein [Caldilineales bacterium]